MQRPEDQATGMVEKGWTPDCGRCRHYFVTHDPRQPMGCRAYGFKSRQQPSRVVLTTSGTPCHFFAPRQPA